MFFACISKQLRSYRSSSEAMFIDHNFQMFIHWWSAIFELPSTLQESVSSAIHVDFKKGWKKASYFLSTFLAIWGYKNAFHKYNYVLRKQAVIQFCNLLCTLKLYIVIQIC